MWKAIRYGEERLTLFSLCFLLFSNRSRFDQCAKRTNSDGSHSNWILESISTKGSKKVAFDFDTGRVSPLPKHWQNLPPEEIPVKEIEQWAIAQGFDMLGVQVPSQRDETCYAIKILGMQVWELDKSRWKSNPSSITLEELMTEGRPVQDYLFHEDKNFVDHLATASFLVITREGTVLPKLKQ